MQNHKYQRKLGCCWNGIFLLTPYYDSWVNCPCGIDINIDDIGSKQVRTEVPVDGQTIIKYSLVGRTMDLTVARQSLLYH